MQNNIPIDIGNKLVTAINFLANDMFFKIYFSGYMTERIDMLIKLLFLNTPLYHFGLHYSVLGCKCELKTILLKPNEKHILDLSNIVKDGKVIFINYTPGSGGLAPIQMHGNTPFTNFIPSVISLYSIPLVDNNPRDTSVSVLYWYCSKELSADVAANSLIKGFDAFRLQDYNNMVVNLHMGIEFLLTRCIEQIIKEYNISTENINIHKLRSSFSKKMIKAFPYIVSLKKVEMPSSEILTSFKEVTDARNDIAHKGKLQVIITESKARIMVSNTFLLYKYIKIMLNAK